MSTSLKQYVSLLLKEEIKLPPRNVEIFFVKIVPSKIKKFRNVAGALFEIVQKNNQDLVQDFFREINLDLDHIVFLTKKRNDELSHLESMLEYFPQLKEIKTIRYILDASERFLEHGLKHLSQTKQKIFEKEEEIKSVSEEYSKTSKRYYDQDFPKELPKGLLLFAKAIDELEQIANDVVQKTKAFLRSLTYQSSGEETPPEHSSVEILYHASTNAKEIFKNGFSKEIPEKGGIGGSQTTKSNQKGISFTADLYDAKEIARSLKEVIGIANKIYNFRDVLSWALAEGVSEDEILGDYKISVRSQYKKSLSDIKVVFELYQRYLTFSKKRYNPLYFGVSINSFKGLSESDVGVLKVKVDMTHPSISYFSGMKEFRVPIEGVIEVVGLVK